MIVAEPLRSPPVACEDADRHRQRGQDRIEERDVHMLAAAGAVAIAQREQDAAEGVEAGHVVGNRDAGADRRAVGRPGDVHESGFGLHDRVVAGE